LQPFRCTYKIFRELKKLDGVGDGVDANVGFASELKELVGVGSLGEIIALKKLVGVGVGANIVLVGVGT
jgi:hypothetical protein